MSDDKLLGMRILTSEDVPTDTVIFAQSLRRGLEIRGAGFALVEEFRELGRIMKIEPVSPTPRPEA